MPHTGKCTTKDDCFSIYNDPYPVSMCVGDIICHNGLCVADCDPILEEFDCSNKDNAPNVGTYMNIERMCCCTWYFR